MESMDPVILSAWCVGLQSIVAIYDPFTDLSYMVYMFQYDVMNTKYKGIVEVKTGKLAINGKAFTIFQLWDPTDTKWIGVEYIVESTGIFTTIGKARVT